MVLLSTKAVIRSTRSIFWPRARWASPLAATVVSTSWSSRETRSASLTFPGISNNSLTRSYRSSLRVNCPNTSRRTFFKICCGIMTSPRLAFTASSLCRSLRKRAVRCSIWAWLSWETCSATSLRFSKTYSGRPSSSSKRLCRQSNVVLSSLNRFSHLCGPGIPWIRSRIRKANDSSCPSASSWSWSKGD